MWHRYAALLAWNQANGTSEGGDQGLLNEFFGEWFTAGPAHTAHSHAVHLPPGALLMTCAMCGTRFYGAWDDQETGRLPWIMNVAAAHYRGYRTLSAMQVCGLHVSYVHASYI